MKVVTYNIQFGRGRDGRIELGRIAAALEGADIIALQEVERFWERSGDIDQPAVLASLLPSHDWAFGAYFDVHGGGKGQRRQFGNMVLSRWPILVTRAVVLPMEPGPRYNMRQGMVEALIETPLGVLRIWNLHLGYQEAPERLAQLDRVAEILAEPEAAQAAWCGNSGLGADDWSNGTAPTPPAAATILLGDFNARPGSAEYRRVTAPRPEGLGYLDSRVIGGGPTGEPVTYRGRATEAERDICLDYCFLEGGKGLGCRGYRVDGGAVGSDHQPVWQEIVSKD